MPDISPRSGGPLDFPSAGLVVGQVFTVGNESWVWDGAKWITFGSGGGGTTVAGVSTFNSRTGAVTLIGSDITGAGGALSASPVLTGNPTAPTPSPGDNDQSIATTAFVTTTVNTALGSVVGGAAVGDTPPAAPIQGTLWWDSVSGQLYIRYVDPNTSQWVVASSEGISDAPADGNLYGRSNATWVQVPTSGGSGGVSVTVSDTAPSSPSVGALWFDSVGAQLYVWGTDGNSQQWTAANSLMGGPYIATAGGTMTGSLVLAGPPTTALQAATKAYADTQAALNAGRNYVQNAAFNIWQRGTGAFTAIGYTADRWYLSFSGDTNSVSRQTASDIMRTAVGDEAWQYYISNSFTGTAAATAYSELIHAVENVRRLSGKTVTLSFWAWVSVGTAQLGLSGYNYYGSGGSPSAADAFPPIAPAQLTSAVQRFSRTFTIPSAAGKTLGTNNNDGTNFQFWFSSGANNAPTAGIGVQSGTFNIWGVQLEIGTQATALDYGGSPQQQLAQCQRFYTTTYCGFYGYSTAGSGFGATVTFPVTMRATPTIGFSNQTYINASGTAFATGTPYGFRPYAICTATGVCAFDAVYTASADL